MNSSKRQPSLPVGRTARLAFEIDSLRKHCSQSAEYLVSQDPYDEAELEECARLDEALAKAHRLLRQTVRSIMVSRLNRRSRAR
ncbi:MAG: hypothetical protein C5B50_27730 [Verrucomicrobia bacterium]|nr:MAG: hypothetical protein C5B50_27730 [Verrucomicrobiota bacterium]